jgi:hypothetical protein
MKKIIMISGVALLASVGSLCAQNRQVDKPFFEQLKKSGVSTKSVNPETFRKKLETQGFNQQKPLTVREFFEQMTLQGAKVPAGFDREAFFKKVQTQGVEVPDYITFPKKSD